MRVYNELMGLLGRATIRQHMGIASEIFYLEFGLSPCELLVENNRIVSLFCNYAKSRMLRHKCYRSLDWFPFIGRHDDVVHNAIARRRWRYLIPPLENDKLLGVCVWVYACVCLHFLLFITRYSADTHFCWHIETLFVKISKVSLESE